MYVYSRRCSIVTHFNIWLWQPCPATRRAQSRPMISATGVGRTSIDLRRGKASRRKPRSSPEVRSDSNTWPELREKTRRYLEHGTQMVSHECMRTARVNPHKPWTMTS